MQYQSFPGTRGGSLSPEKLMALRLPSLKGKRFLDVGCNEGYFCGYALFEGAEKVVGIDKSAEAIRKAGLRFPEVSFIKQSWDVLPEDRFDVITLLSALHYADDQAALVHRLMASLDDDGLLVLEISIAPEGGDEWVKVKRSIDERYFPTRRKLNSLLADYAWKVIGHSVNQAGDPLQRYVVHVRKTRPYAYLMMENPGSGKSTLGRKLFRKAALPVISGDRTYLKVSQEELEVSAPLYSAVSENFTTASIDKVTDRVFSQGLVQELVELWIKQAAHKDFALDSYVPETFRSAVRDEFFAQGYFPVDLTWSIDQALKAPSTDPRRAKDYESFLNTRAATDLNAGLKVTRCMPDRLKQILRWHLDAPVNGQLFQADEALTVSGWMIKMDETSEPLELYVENDLGREVFSPSRRRKDVLQAVYGEAENVPVFWRDAPCGFKVAVKDTGTTAVFGIIIEGEAVPLARISSTVKNEPNGHFGKALLGKFRKSK